MTIKEYLDKTCIKHIEFAKKCGIKRSAFSRYANGSRKPDILTCIRIKKQSNGLITQYDDLISKITEAQ